MDKVEEQLGFLTAEVKIVREYAISHQEKLEDYGERIEVLESRI